MVPDHYRSETGLCTVTIAIPSNFLLVMDWIMRRATDTSPTGWSGLMAND